MPIDNDKNEFAGLTSNEIEILREKFGINLAGETSIDDIQKQFENTRERIKEIEEKALAKLKAKPPEPKCSFCGKPESEVNRMVGSQISLAHICDVCIKTSMDLINE